MVGELGVDVRVRHVRYEREKPEAFLLLGVLGGLVLRLLFLGRLLAAPPLLPQLLESSKTHLILALLAFDPHEVCFFFVFLVVLLLLLFFLFS